VKSSTSAYPEAAIPTLKERTKGPGKPPTTLRYQDDPASVKALIAGLPADAFQTITWRRRTRTGPGNPDAAMRSRFTTLRIRPANRNIPRQGDGSLPAEWLIAELPTDAAEPTDYLLSTLPEDTSSSRRCA